MENILFTQSDLISMHIHTLILNLLKRSSTVRNRMLSWLGNCLKANIDRGKLWNVQQMPEFNPNNYTTVSDGFMINFAAVLMRLCQPFCSPGNEKKILKVDPTYCAVENEQCSQRNVHMFDLSKETCLIPNTAEDSDVVPPRDTVGTYNFMTECFFMGHKALELGFAVTVDKLVRLNQEMGRIERVYNDAVGQSGGHADVADAIKQRMSTELTKYLSIKTALSETNLIEMIFNCVSASCQWLTQIAVHGDSTHENTFAPMELKEVTFPIENSLNNSLK